MTGDLRKLTHASPFIPFTLHLADGGAVRVPTQDHIAVAPKGGRVVVYGDDDDYAVLSPLLISRVSVDRGSTAM